VFNIKVFKIVFHRAFRLAGKNDEAALELYKKLLSGLDSLLAHTKPEGTFYHGKVLCEMAKAYSNLGKKTEALESLNKGKMIFESEFGTDHGVYLDYLRAEIEVENEVRRLDNEALLNLVE
jgi:tetratricopeptide (TPR) repeat protein